MLCSAATNMYKFIGSLVDSCITCQLTNSFDDNYKCFQELRNIAGLKA